MARSARYLAPTRPNAWLGLCTLPPPDETPVASPQTDAKDCEVAQLRSAPAYERDAGRWRAVLEDPHRTETEAQAALAQPPGFVNVQAQAVREYLLGKQYEKAPAALSTLILV